jgi:hypothetical protein
MEPLDALLATDHRQTLEFFFVELKDISEPGADRQELLYNASVLAHFAQISTHGTGDVPAPSTLADVFDHFVCDASVCDDPDLMETAGAQCLMLAGFFEAQMKRRHNIRWYATLGAGFFDRAARTVRSTPKALLLSTMARRFEPWRRRYARLGRDLQERRYMLTNPYRYRSAL